MKKFGSIILILMIIFGTFETFASNDNLDSSIYKTNILSKEEVLQMIFPNIMTCRSIYNNKVYLNVYCHPNIYIDGLTFIYFRNPDYFGNNETEILTKIVEDLQNEWLVHDSYYINENDKNEKEIIGKKGNSNNE